MLPRIDKRSQPRNRIFLVGSTSPIVLIHVFLFPLLLSTSPPSVQLEFVRQETARSTQEMFDLLGVAE